MIYEIINTTMDTLEPLVPVISQNYHDYIPVSISQTVDEFLPFESGSIHENKYNGVRVHYVDSYFVTNTTEPGPNNLNEEETQLVEESTDLLLDSRKEYHNFKRGWRILTKQLENKKEYEAYKDSLGIPPDRKLGAKIARNNRLIYKNIKLVRNSQLEICLNAERQMKLEKSLIELAKTKPNVELLIKDWEKAKKCAYFVQKKNYLLSTNQKKNVYLFTQKNFYLFEEWVKKMKF